MSFNTIAVIDCRSNAASTLQADFIALLRAAPPATVKKTIVLTDSKYTLRRDCIAALKRVGYADIEAIDTLCIELSFCIFNLPSRCEIGKLVFVYLGDDIPYSQRPIIVIQKRANGWQILNTEQDLLTALDHHPSVRDVIVSCEATEERRDEFLTLFPNQRVHFLSRPMDPGFEASFIRNQINNGTLDGCNVLPYCSFNLRIVSGNRHALTKLTDRVPLFTVTQNFDVGDVSQVKVYALPPGENKSPSIIKTFDLKNVNGFQTVLVTVTVEKTLIPQLTLKTISIYKPPSRSTPIIFTVTHPETAFVLEAIRPDHVSYEGHFTSADDLVAHMTKVASPSATVAVNFLNSNDSMLKELQNFQAACHQAGYANVKFIEMESVYLSLLLDYAKVSIKANELVAVLFPESFYIVTRDGKHLRVLEKGDPSDFNAKKSKVKTVIIDNSCNIYTGADLHHLQNTFSQCIISIVSGKSQLNSSKSKYFWSLANGTDFGGNIFHNFGDFDFVIEDHGMFDTIHTRFKVLPYTVTAETKACLAQVLRVHLAVCDGFFEELEEFNVIPGAVVMFTIHVESICDITVTMGIVSWTIPRVRDMVPKVVVVEALESNDGAGKPKGKKHRKKKKKVAKDVALMVTEMSEMPKLTDSSLVIHAISNIKMAPEPPVTLTFTLDNRVIIEADESYGELGGYTVAAELSAAKLSGLRCHTAESYTGRKEVLAYVCFQSSGKPPLIGSDAYKVLKINPNSVFYDIPRLLVADFNPDEPNPSWGFKTSRNKAGKTIVTAGDVTTFPIVLFGLIVKSTLLYIQKHTLSEVTILGIRLPVGSVIDEFELKAVSERIETTLIIIQ